MTRDPWLRLGRNALWIVVPLIASFVFGRRTTSELASNLLWLGPVLGFGVILFKILVWNARRPHGQRVPNVTTQTPWWKYEPMAGPPLRMPSREGVGVGITVLLEMLFYFATFIGAAYVVIHFIAKYW